MIGGASVWSSDEHTRIGGEIGAYIHRLGEKAHRDLDVVRYNRHGSFCIVEYLSPNRDVFIDVMNLRESLANFDRGKAEELNQRLFAPMTAEETCRKLAEADSDYYHMRQEWNDEERERCERVARGE